MHILYLTSNIFSDILFVLKELYSDSVSGSHSWSVEGVTKTASIFLGKF